VFFSPPFYLTALRSGKAQSDSCLSGRFDLAILWLFVGLRDWCPCSSILFTRGKERARCDFELFMRFEGACPPPIGAPYPTLFSRSPPPLLSCSQLRRHTLSSFSFPRFLGLVSLFFLLPRGREDLLYLYFNPFFLMSGLLKEGCHEFFFFFRPNFF